MRIDSLETAVEELRDSLLMEREAAARLRAEQIGARDALGRAQSRIDSMVAAAASPFVVTSSFWQSIKFGTGSSTLTLDTDKIVDQYERLLKANKDLRIGLIGRADYRGAEAFNFRLTRDRVDSVYEALLAREIEPWRIERMPVGELSPLTYGYTEDALAENRSVQAVVLESPRFVRLSSVPSGAAVWMFREDADYPGIASNLDRPSAIERYKVNEQTTDVTVKRPAAYWVVMMERDGERRFACGIKSGSDTTVVSIDFRQQDNKLPCATKSSNLWIR